MPLLVPAHRAFRQNEFVKKALHSAWPPTWNTSFLLRSFLKSTPLLYPTKEKRRLQRRFSICMPIFSTTELKTILVKDGSRRAGRRSRPNWKTSFSSQCSSRAHPSSKTFSPETFLKRHARHLDSWAKKTPMPKTFFKKHTTLLDRRTKKHSRKRRYSQRTVFW